MMVVGDGYIPYHFRVLVEAESKQEFEQIAAQVMAIKSELEGAPGVDSFPEAVIEWLWRVPGVVQVCPDGAISSVINALKMVRAMGGRPCVMGGALGTGLIADAIQEDLAEAGVGLHATVRTTGDSSIEIALYDTRFRFDHEFQIHFMPPRDRSHLFRLQDGWEETVEAFVMSRANRGRAAAARELSGRGRLISLCIGGFGRHLHPEDYLEIVRTSQQVLVHNLEMRQMGRALGITLPAAWQPDPSDGCVCRLAESLGTLGGGRRLVALVFRRTVSLYVPDLEMTAFRVPETVRHRVPVSRFHGALITLSLPWENCLPATALEMESLGSTALQAALHGCDQFPLAYPSPGITPGETWREGSRSGTLPPVKGIAAVAAA